MAVTPSTMQLQLGDKAPDFSLPDTDGNVVSLTDLAGSKAYLIIFMCNHCPYVKAVLDRIIRDARDLAAEGISCVAISSNDPAAYPEDSFENMQKIARERDFPFPYLYDESQTVAKAYRAACTPDFFLFDDELKLVYRGQFDGSRPGNDVPVTGEDLRAAVDALLEGEPVPEDQTPSAGCNIKWKPDNEPEYFGA